MEKANDTYKPNLNAGLLAYQKSMREAAEERQAVEALCRQMRKDAAPMRARAAQQARSSKRRAIERQRFPAWADIDAIKQVYRKAQEISTKTGIPHHVDHIYPLAGALVSGLHVHNNLQVLSAIENMKKHNRFEVDP